MTVESFSANALFDWLVNKEDFLLLDVRNDVEFDRFKVEGPYPFDMVKALFYYLELTTIPEQQMHDLIEKLEGIYKQQYGKPYHKPLAKAEDISPLDDEMTELRESLKYAAMVGELELEEELEEA